MASPEEGITQNGISAIAFTNPQTKEEGILAAFNFPSVEVSPNGDFIPPTLGQYGGDSGLSIAPYSVRDAADVRNKAVLAGIAPTGQFGQTGSALASFSGRAWLAFLSHDSSNRILICNSTDGVNWAAPNSDPAGSMPVGGQTAQSNIAPALLGFKGRNPYGRLFLAFISNDSDNRVLICNSTYGLTWKGTSNYQVQGQSAQGSPSLASINEMLYVAFISNDSHNRILISSSSDGENWSAPDGNPSGNVAIPGQSSQSSPSLASHEGKLYVAFISNDSHNRVLISCSSDGKTWTAPDNNPSGNTPVQGESSAYAPALFVFAGQLWVAFVSNDGNSALLFCSSSDLARTWTRRFP
jgi:hypothetical protein